ncbi:haloacid dehalogenase type II [uncultured Vibrio sp.]|uniref:haloacid dehalogenase type II n=1 Tax=uncultured Vibrio sp. TaxID=114054 RepID=UPI0025F8F975|nr:haloacid dehalogenase type II [uncultured Vibrio sp.]
MQQPTVLFDINETVLNLNSLRPKFHQYLGDESHMDTWFAMLLHSSTVCLATSVNTNFKRLSQEALLILAGRLNKTLTDEECDDVLSTFASLSAHSDVVPALESLRSAGFNVVALSNSSQALLDAQLTNAGVIELFDRVISVESAGTFKPAPEAYHYALAELSVSGENTYLIATHDWDTHGALCAGLNAAFINRFNAPYNALYRKPDIVGSTMTSIVEKIIAHAQSSH